MIFSHLWSLYLIKNTNLWGVSVSLVEWTRISFEFKCIFQNFYWLCTYRNEILWQKIIVIFKSGPDVSRIKIILWFYTGELCLMDISTFILIRFFCDLKAFCMAILVIYSSLHQEPDVIGKTNNLLRTKLPIDAFTKVPPLRETLQPRHLKMVISLFGPYILFTFPAQLRQPLLVKLSSLEQHLEGGDQTAALCSTWNIIT